MKQYTKAILWRCEAQRNNARKIGVGELCLPLCANRKRNPSVKVK